MMAKTFRLKTILDFGGGDGGEPVIVAIPEETGRSHIMLPALLSAQFQNKFPTVISDVASTGNSGSGVFEAGQKCLLGIISLKSTKPRPEQPPKTSKKIPPNILSRHRDLHTA